MLVHPEMGFQKAQWKENRSVGRSMVPYMVVRI